MRMPLAITSYDMSTVLCAFVKTLSIYCYKSLLHSHVPSYTSPYMVSDYSAYSEWHTSQLL